MGMRPVDNDVAFGWCDRIFTKPSLHVLFVPGCVLGDHEQFAIGLHRPARYLEEQLRNAKVRVVRRVGEHQIVLTGIRDLTLIGPYCRNVSQFIELGTSSRALDGS